MKAQSYGWCICNNNILQEAECDKTKMDTKFSADAKIADASRNYKMQKAGFDQEVNARVSTDPSKCINDQTLRSDTEFCRTSLLKLSDQIVRQNPPRSEWESPLSDS